MSHIIHLRHYRTEAVDTQPGVYPACQGPCEQGRRDCPSPDACLLAEPGIHNPRMVAFAIAIGVLLWVAISAVLWMLIR